MLICCLHVSSCTYCVILVAGPPESVVDWTKESESDLANPKYRRLLYCQNGQSNILIPFIVDPLFLLSDDISLLMSGCRASHFRGASQC